MKKKQAERLNQLNEFYVNSPSTMTAEQLQEYKTLCRESQLEESSQKWNPHRFYHPEFLREAEKMQRTSPEDWNKMVEANHYPPSPFSCFGE